MARHAAVLGSRVTAMGAAGIVRSALWADLLPAGVVAYETRGRVDVTRLHEGERDAVRNAVDKRVQEFAAGRACAHAALAEFGVHGFPLLRGADRSPSWPPGLVGSITHATGYCGAAVASHAQFAGIGIDAELLGQVSDDLLPLICTPEERAWLAGLDDRTRPDVATILFSAKEAFFKCQSGAADRLEEFHDVELHLDSGQFRVEPRSRRTAAFSRRQPVTGRYAIVDGMAFTGIGLPLE